MNQTKSPQRLVGLILSATLLAACAAPSVPLITQTVDACAEATDPGARASLPFEEILPCLNTVPKVSAFMATNMERDDDWDFKECGEICYSPAWLVYQNGVDSLHGLVTLECYFLEENGLDAYHIGLAIELPTGTNLCGVVIDGGILILDYDGKTVGTFESLPDVMSYYNDIGVGIGGQLRTIKASQITEVATNHTAPTILELPWVIQSY